MQRGKPPFHQTSFSQLTSSNSRSFREGLRFSPKKPWAFAFSTLITRGSRWFPSLFWNGNKIITRVVSTPLKNISQIGSFPQVGLKIKIIWNHQLDNCFGNADKIGVPILSELQPHQETAWLPNVMANHHSEIPGGCVKRNLGRADGGSWSVG